MQFTIDVSMPVSDVIELTPDQIWARFEGNLLAHFAKRNGLGNASLQDYEVDMLQSSAINLSNGVLTFEVLGDIVAYD